MEQRRTSMTEIGHLSKHRKHTSQQVLGPENLGVGLHIDDIMQLCLQSKLHIDVKLLQKCYKQAPWWDGCNNNIKHMVTHSTIKLWVINKALQRRPFNPRTQGAMERQETKHDERWTSLATEKIIYSQQDRVQLIIGLLGLEIDQVTLKSTSCTSLKIRSVKDGKDQMKYT